MLIIFWSFQKVTLNSDDLFVEIIRMFGEKKYKQEAFIHATRCPNAIISYESF